MTVSPLHTCCVYSCVYVSYYMTCTHLYLYAYSVCMHIYISISLSLSIYIYICVYIYIYTHIHTYTYIYIHITYTLFCRCTSSLLRLLRGLGGRSGMTSSIINVHCNMGANVTACGDMRQSFGDLWHLCKQLRLSFLRLDASEC